MSPSELKRIVSDGLLSFPVTDFDQNGDFRPDTYASRLEWLAPYGASALFVAGGTGEFFSLGLDEYADVVRVGVQACSGKVPIIAGAGGATRNAIAYAQQAEKQGAQGVLLMPHYLTEASQDGIVRHVEQVCKSVSLGVIVYNRAQCQLDADHLEDLAQRCPNLVGFKDGLGNIELMVTIRRRLGDRFAYLGGLPTAEFYAAAYRALGVPVYSSAVFNFIPRTALQFYQAIVAGDTATQGRIMDEFFIPYARIRNRCKGYAVSIIKAGARLVGRDAGPVRAPLTDLTPQDCADLAVLIEKAGSQK
ncbi:5-dehydro-4-deoxyglucarate dehydratase [Candidimonas nitroreducens]|uniref:Probable 5-dehydro-4-deoxyglucarate dehydratase n=1 Tax=Candidimonas nitroreducens TaxID=683354 RepID=A0A225M904_9BURK|nr:5-dehydro-4-deoxyglucarate dehydratase [Candidimonas nitroreducens]OWT57596.1 5-dehydro-4-deoxyglucarate dehydratase [Candidimonas nitroreducens]